MANKGEWSSLYQHPKMMQLYYWKDDNNASRIKRTTELKNVMSNPIKGRVQRNKLLQPVLLSHHSSVVPSAAAQRTCGPF
jgi:hypothetical protein